MAVETHHAGNVYPVASPTRLSVIEGEGTGSLESRDLFEKYFALRIATSFVDKVEGDELSDIQSDVSVWLTQNYPDKDAPGTVEDYRTYDSTVVNEKIGNLVDFLKTNHSDKISDLELDTTRAFIESAFSMYKDKNKRPDELEDQDGSFAFVVPARMSRKYPMYGSEVEPVIPALRYVPNEMRAWIMRGCPPFIIDTYKEDENGRRGYLVYAPVTEDMQDDLATQSTGEFIKAAQGAVNDAVDFAADRLGVRVIGLGATLPKVTNHGKSITRDDIITTTGHGGTAWLITETINNNRTESQKQIGVIGLGYIGAAAAGVAAEMYSSKIKIYDADESKMRKLAATYPEQFEPAENAASLITESDVIISAVTRPLHMRELGISEMQGKLIVDDSQPASFTPEEVEGLGGKAVWVIGRDNSGNIRRTGYDYGTMHDPISDLFGCEAEAATLAMHWARMESLGISKEGARRIIGSLALRGPVTTESASRIGELFKFYGIGTSNPQAFGKLVDTAE